MVFSSSIFLFLFLPLVLAGYFCLKDNYRNIWILLVSLFFYSWGEPGYVYLMVLTICLNYVLALFMVRLDKLLFRRLVLFVTVMSNLLILGYFKYVDFLIGILNNIFGETFSLQDVPLPIGISFFIFQSISYVIDVYRKEVKAQRNILHLGLYIALFPQLIAGPIVRYKSIEAEISNRKVTIERFSSGVRQFMIGFSKKMLIADQLAPFVNDIFAIDGGSCLVAWLGAIAYTLQIFFDFSGYSDMAIGLGRMFGFTFPVNFNYPYISSSIKEFWRRWHMSLSSWFKDYVYIPLGGNRNGKLRTYVNLWIVFFLTGLWHGASLNFVVWGLYHGCFLVLERLGVDKLLGRLPVILRHLYLIVLVVIGWVFFNAHDLSHAINYIKTMFSYNGREYIDYVIYMDRQYMICLILGIIFSMPIMDWIKNKVLYGNRVFDLVNDIVLVFMFILAISCMHGAGFSPFLYFRF